MGVEGLKGVHLVSLCEALCQCVEVAGSPDHHDLAIMETALSSIVNITSRYIRMGGFAMNSSKVITPISKSKQISMIL